MWIQKSVNCSNHCIFLFHTSEFRNGPIFRNLFDFEVSVYDYLATFMVHSQSHGQKTLLNLRLYFLLKLHMWLVTQPVIISMHCWCYSGKQWPISFRTQPLAAGEGCFLLVSAICRSVSVTGGALTTNATLLFALTLALGSLNVSTYYLWFLRLKQYLQTRPHASCFWHIYCQFQKSNRTVGIIILLSHVINPAEQMAWG